MLLHLGPSIQCIRKRTLRKFVLEIVGVKDDKVCYTDTAQFTWKKVMEKSEQKSSVEEKMGPGENDYGDGGIDNAVFRAPEVKIYPTNNECRIIEDRTFEAFDDAKTLLNCKQHFDFLEGESISGKCPLSWKRSFGSGVEIPSKPTNCEDYCKSESKTCEKNVFQHREIKTN